MSNSTVDFMRSLIGQDTAGSPSAVTNWLQARLREVEVGRVVVHVVLRDDMMNPGGTLHGGVSSLIMDDIIGAATYTLNDENYHTSVNLTVDFLSIARTGDTVIVEAKVLRYGKNMVNCDCYIRSEEGKLIARGTSNLFRTANKALRPG